MSEIKIQPLGARVFIEALEQEGQTASGIYIPETAKEKPQSGVVVAVGDDEDIKLKVGDKVMFAKYSGTDFKFENKDYVLMECNDVLARFLN